MSDAPLLRPERRQELRGLAQIAAAFHKDAAKGDQHDEWFDSGDFQKDNDYQQTADYLAAFSPDVALALLDENEKLLAERTAHLLGWWYDDEHDAWYGSLEGNGEGPFICLDENLVSHVASLGRVPLSGEAPE